MEAGGNTDALKRVPTGLYGPLKRAEDAIAVLLGGWASNNSFIYPVYLHRLTYVWDM